MKNNLLTKTHYRIVFLISILALFMVAVVYYSNITGKEHVTLLMKEEERESSLLLQKVIAGKTGELATFAKDYTYWDEMVDFTKSRDTLWAIQNIKVSLATYRADYVWVFDTNFARLYFADSGEKPVTDSGMVNMQMLQTIAADSRFFHFFIKSNHGIIEVCGASIHPTSDPERLTPPKGYFAVGRLWSDGVLSDIAEYTGSVITIEEELSKPIGDENTETKGDKNGETKVGKNIDTPLHIKSVYTLLSWDNKPIARVISKEDKPLAEAIEYESDLQLWLMLGFVVMFLVFLSTAMYFLVNRPMKKISDTLRKNDTSHLLRLMHKKHEFGEMSRLVNEFFIQKEKLLKEISDRIEAEARAKETEKELRNSLNEKVILLKEVHHRVKNNLQIIVSLIRLQADTLEDKAGVSHLNSILSRIRSIAFVHELLYRSQDLGRIDFEEYIKKFTISLIDMYSCGKKRISLEVDAKNILIGVDLAVPCGIIINELVTNSMKHAFTGENEGTIKISMSAANGMYTLSVSDSGTSNAGNLRQKNPASLGMYLVTSLAEQLEAGLEIMAGKNTTFTFIFPES